MYALFSNGYLNGIRKFGSQSVISIISSFVKLVSVICLVLIGTGVKGAIWGYTISATAGLIIAWWIIKPKFINRISISYKYIISFSIPATFFAIAILLLLNIDLFCVKAFNIIKYRYRLLQCGKYSIKFPYLIFTGLTVVLFPSIAKATSPIT